MQAFKFIDGFMMLNLRWLLLGVLVPLTLVVTVFRATQI
jgi:hypothetical protein